MKLTNTNLIGILLWSGINPNQLIDLFFVVSKLNKRFWRLLFSSKYIDEIYNIDKTVWDIIVILKKTNKIQYQDVKNLISIVKNNAKDYSPEFNINSTSGINISGLEKHINLKFKDSKINHKSIDEIWVSINWEWWYYKKTLNSDIEKILS